jgi:inner membrane transporter RhtA
MVAIQTGNVIAVTLFPLVGVAGVALMRMLFGGVVLLLLSAPPWALARRHWRLWVPMGIGLGIQSLCMYSAISKVGVAIAVPIAFVGPLALACVGRRSLQAAAWPALALVGVVLLTRPFSGEGSVDPVGILLAGVAACLWVVYIKLAGRIGAELHGFQSAGLALTTAGIVILPLAVATAGLTLLHPTVLLRGLACALLSAALGNGLEFQALQSMPPRLYGVLISFEPVIAAALGFLLLGERLTVVQWLGVSTIAGACVGAVRS